MPEHLVFTHTERGFVAGHFFDARDKLCAIQESSSADEPKLWLGPHGERMHLTQSMAAELIPHIVHFAETGHLSPSADTP